MQAGTRDPQSINYRVLRREQRRQDRGFGDDEVSSCGEQLSFTFQVTFYNRFRRF